MSIFVPHVCLNCGKQVFVNIDTETGLINLTCPHCKKPLHKLEPEKKADDKFLDLAKGALRILEDAAEKKQKEKP